MTATPTPGDLSARLLAAVNACEANKMPGTAKLLREAAAALSALPAAGLEVSGLALAVIGREHFGNPIPQEWYAAARTLLNRTTPQPSAAEKVGCEGDDGLLRIHAESETCDVCAAVGARGDGDD